MFAKKTKKPALSRKDQKKIKAAIERNRKNSHRPDSAQKTIPYQQMFPDGLCCLTDKTYSRTIQFLDINYRLVQDEDKAEIFNAWCSFLNHFDSSVHFQLSFYNLIQAPDDDNILVEIPNQNDAFDAIRREYNTMLQNQLAKGNYGIRRTKYLTFFRLSLSSSNHAFY